VLFGVGSDYFLFLVFRYRENLRAGREPKQAMVPAVARVGQAITSAAAVVIAAFMALVFSTLGQLRAYGPALAIAVAVTLAAALTLVPAVISLLGTKVFWPSRSYSRPVRQRASRVAGALVRRFPAIVATTAALIMVTLAAYALGFTPRFDQTTSGPQDLESVVAQQDLERGFAAGQTQPTDVVVASKDGSKLPRPALAALRDSLQSVPGVGDVESVTLNRTGDAARLIVVLDDAPTSDKAITLAGGALRETAHANAPAGSAAYVGGLSSVLADIQTAINRDYRVVFPVASLAILLILALLVSSVAAPWYLMASVALGFVASLGATVVIFQQLRDQEGLLFTLPILMYLFVVAIGTDYNIVMVTRIREETRRGLTTRAAAGVAVRHTASTIAAGGAILGGTFAVLTAANDPSLQQLGAGISVGIAISAFVMAIFLTPALTALLGRRAFWPGSRHDAEETTDTPNGPAPRPREQAADLAR
jgi:putative drug exporter of the RND superfamily